MKAGINIQDNLSRQYPASRPRGVLGKMKARTSATVLPEATKLITIIIIFQSTTGLWSQKTSLVSQSC